MLTPTGSILIPSEFILPLVLFVAIAVGFAVISEGLRTAWDRAATAERAKDLLLQELGHRTKNNLAMVISIMSMQARSKSNPEAQRALEKAIARVHAIASAHEHFHAVEHRGRVEMRAYLERLCTQLGDAFRELRPIAVKVNSAELYLAPEQAVPLGLIVNELVTNSLKHAFLRRTPRFLSSCEMPVPPDRTQAEYSPCTAPVPLHRLHSNIQRRIALGLTPASLSPALPLRRPPPCTLAPRYESAPDADS